MSQLVKVEVDDPQASIADALDPARGATRGQFLRRAVFGGGALTLSGVTLSGLPSLALGASASNDVTILNFALFLEYLEAAFYTEAEAKGLLTGEVRAFAGIVGAHERTHRDFIRSALGSKAINSPTFDFGDTTSSDAKFVATSIALEDTGVSAYNGQGTNLTRKTLATAATIVSVEARHAAWIRDIADTTAGLTKSSGGPAPSAFDKALTKSQVQAAVGQTGFVK